MRWTDPNLLVHNQALIATALNKVDAAASRHIHNEASRSLADVVPARFDSICPHGTSSMFAFNAHTGVDRAMYWAMAGMVCQQCSDQLGEDGEIYVIPPESGPACLLGRGSRTGGELRLLRVIDDEPWQVRQVKLAMLMVQFEELRWAVEDTLQAAREAVMELIAASALPRAAMLIDTTRTSPPRGCTRGASTAPRRTGSSAHPRTSTPSTHAVSSPRTAGSVARSPLVAGSTCSRRKWPSKTGRHRDTPSRRRPPLRRPRTGP